MFVPSSPILERSSPLNLTIIEETGIVSKQLFLSNNFSGVVVEFKSSCTSLLPGEVQAINQMEDTINDDETHNYRDREWRAAPFRG